MLMKRFSPIICTFLAVLMLISLSACGTKDNDVSSSTSTASGTNANTGTGGQLSGALISKDKITLKILTTEWSGINVGNDMPVYQELEKRTNIHLDFNLLPLTNPTEKFNLIMASGDLPDIIGYANPDLLTKYGSEGAIIPVQDLIKQHAPDIKKALDNPLPNDKLPYKLNIWSEITANDGNMYAVPIISSSSAIGAIYAMRSDWLEKLSLKVPTTSEELYTVLKAFKERDPNGNQKQDEIPFFSSSGGKTNTILPIINAFDAHMSYYVDPKDDKIKYGPTEANFKEGLQYMNRLYKEGLLEQDYLTATRDQWLARGTGNLGGFMYASPAGGVGTTNGGLQKLDSKFVFDPIAPLKSKSGKQYKDSASSGRYVQMRCAITKSNKYPVETIKYFNYCFTEEGNRLVSYGIEGKHFTLVNGKPEYTDLILKNPKGLDTELARISDGINWTALPYAIGWESHFQANKVAGPATVKAWELYREPGMVEAPLPSLKFTDAEFAKRAALVAEIDTYKTPMIDKFIMGDEPFEKFDEYVSKINKSGIEELLKIMNDSYARYKKSGS